MGRRPSASILLRLLGVALAAGLLYWIIRKTGAMPLEALKGAEPGLLLIALLLVGSSHLLGGMRLGRLLSVQGMVFGTSAMFKLTLLGNLFSQVIPGAVSGDVLKIAYIARRYPNHGAAAIMAALLDRIAGVSGLFLMASIGCAGFWLAMPQQVMAANHGVLAMTFVLVFCVGLGVTLALPAVVYHRALLRIPLFRRLGALANRCLPRAVVAFLERLCAASDAYAAHKGVLVSILLMSMLIHFNLSAALFFIGRAIGEQTFGFGDYFLGALLGNAVTLIPATPGGAGLRDSTTALVFGLLGHAQAPLNGSIPVIYTLLAILWGIAGIWPLLTLPGYRNSRT